jgi:hypothetical protein
MKKVIFDTDIGIDDAMALLFLHYSPAVDLRAIVTGFGNASIETTTRNALYMIVLRSHFREGCRHDTRHTLAPGSTVLALQGQADCVHVGRPDSL